jgi:hypothetical protein
MLNYLNKVFGTFGILFGLIIFINDMFDKINLLDKTTYVYFFFIFWGVCGILSLTDLIIYYLKYEVLN